MFVQPLLNQSDSYCWRIVSVWWLNKGWSSSVVQHNKVINFKTKKQCLRWMWRAESLRNNTVVSVFLDKACLYPDTESVVFFSCPPTEMNRHHYSLYVHNCRLVFLLRRDFTQVDTFRPAEFHWKLEQVRGWRPGTCSGWGSACVTYVNSSAHLGGFDWVGCGSMRPGCWTDTWLFSF